MQLLFIRHAIAGERDEFARTGAPDSERPLADLGRRRMRAVAEGLKRLIPVIDLLATSPLVRTTETADIIAEEYGGLEPVPVVALAPQGSPSAFLNWLHDRQADGIIAAVGHDPSLPQLVGLLLTGKPAPVIAMKKGGACLIRIEGSPRPGAAVLLWALAPAHLRDIGRGQ